ncbi:hybrid sensor histidine kinase/response regulator [Rhodopseudomonas sp. AAP120]|uniref:PAS domain-containing hybrid sensor histidine kinase/response regulator n=1 Tax=Rhodopseudomonas sp. AAP120 TaxID=1523430 RepID=UPI0009E9C618|nr:hybrid sensor histidine kinase/response regulator [Rhodopseudomonas sp. AAP120]
MHTAVHSYDWSATPLGPTDRWPPPLQVSAATMLAATIPCFLVWGPHQTLLYNDAYIELLAARHPDALGRSFRDVWPEIWPDLEPLVTRAYGGEGLSQQNLQLRMQRKGYEEETWFTYFYTPVRLDDGAVAGFLGGCLENTEAMRASKALEEANAKLQQALRDQNAANDAVGRSEARYRALFEALDDGFCIIEFFDGPHGPLSDYVHIEANAGYEKQTGIPDIVGRTLRDLVPDEADGWAELYRSVLLTGQPIHFEREFIAVNRIIEVSATRIEPPELRQVSVLFRDITARKQAEAALRQSETIARENVQRVQLALAAGAIIGTWLWDLPSDRFTVDEAFARSFGLDPAKGRDGLSLAQVVETVHPDDQAGLAAAINEAIRRGGPYAHQYRVRRADGKYYWLEANGRVDLGPDGTPLSFPGVLIDVNDRRALVEERDRAIAELRALNETLEQRVAESRAELMRSEEQLRQSQKMEAVGQLTGGLAHDFNNLLAGISGSLELMATRISQGRIKDVDKYLVAAQGAVKRAASLTHRLLAFARRQTLTPTAANVNKLVSGMLDLVQRTVGPGIEVQHVGATGLWAVLVDVPQLESALLNLCINARDAMPDGGKITIETGNRWIDRAQSKIYDIPTGQYVSLCVSDTGTGMTRDVIAKAFDPFFTTKPIGKGTGLGLSMIYGFAQQSGGQVRIYSEVGQGTMVCIYLPRYRGEAEDDERSPDSSVISFAEAGETVLIVDDEPTVRMLVADVLGDLGYTALEAADSVAGLKLLQSDARIDLLVTDVGLPGGMNGRQLADAARETRPGLNVLFITGFAENALLNNGQLEPGMAVLTKPFAVDTLAARIRELISK